MSLFGQVLGGRERKTIDASNLLWETILGESSAKSGVRVTLETALRVAAAFACGRVLSEDVAKLPRKLFQEQPDGRKRVATEHPVHKALQWPNEWQTGYEFFETAVLHAIFARGFFAVQSRAPNGNLVELLPVLPHRVTIHQGRDYSLTYEVRDPEDKVIGVFDRSRMFVVRGPSWNGFAGLDFLDVAREVLGLSIAAEEGQARMHSNGIRPSGIVAAEGPLGKVALERLREQVREVHEGRAKWGKILFLDQGSKFTPFNMSGADAQTLETRRFQIEETCRIMRVYPTKIGYSDKASTYASAEQFAIAHVVDSIMPWVARFEGAISRDLLSEASVRAGYFVRFLVQGLLRGDAKSRSEFYKASLGTSSSPGWMSPNDVRRLEDLDPSDQEGADDILTPARLSGQPAATPGNGQAPPEEEEETPGNGLDEDEAEAEADA